MTDYKSILKNLIDNLINDSLCETEIIPWAAPVISFGNLQESRIATLGLNPSNREFVDSSGVELSKNDRRFHTLKSLNLNSWSEVEDVHLDKIIDSCYNYFSGNPYDRWFKSLDKLIVNTNMSYYGLFSKACHLDLVPYATSCKWVELSNIQRNKLLKNASDSLGHLIKESNIELLVLNGQSVINNLELVTNKAFTKEKNPDWTLPRKSGDGVTGYAYTGSIDTINNIDLGRNISVIGYSHNIQSSFGVTNKVKDSIQGWISSTISSKVVSI